MQYLEIDAVKFFACIFIVFLHGIEPGDGIQQALYLTGEYGIPLFWLVNGWLLADREIDFKYANRKAWKYIKFVGVWVLSLGIIISILEHKIAFIDLTIGIISGKGLLFHLWFLLGLCVIYYLVATIRKCCNFNINNVCSSKLFILYMSIILTIAFAINLVVRIIYGVEIRDVIFPCFRIITNGGYFFIGVWLRKIHNTKITKSMNQRGGVLITVFIFSLILSLVVSKALCVQWASSMYCSLPVIYGTIAIFLLVTKRTLKLYSRFYNIISCSTGIWILHPFVLRVINKIYRISISEIISIGDKCFITVLTIIISIIVTLCIKKIKYLRYMIME